MALINYNDLFDKLQEYIDKKIDNLPEELENLFEEYHLKEVAEALPYIKIIAENIDSFVILADNIDSVVICAGISLQIQQVAYIKDEVVSVASVSDEIIVTASMETEIREIGQDPLKTAILNAASNATSAAADALAASLSAAQANYAATLAQNSADDIHDVTVVDPVTAVPLNPDGSTGTPTVTYDPLTGAFTFGIPSGQNGTGIYVQGDFTVTEINAIDPVNLGTGDAFIMLNAGTITTGDPDVVVAIHDWILWTAELAFINIGDIVGPQGVKGDGWTDGTYNDLTGIITFTSDDGLGFVTDDVRGSNGIDGTNGTNGTDGITPTVVAGTTTTLLPGEDATVDDSGTGSDHVFDFGIPEGVKGDTGDTGSQGETGDTGGTGLTGADGVSPTVAVGNTTTLPAGSSATVTDTDPGASASLDFGIPQGPQGSQGIQGDQGVPGAGIYPQGTATVAEMNALVADPAPGDLWIMEDAGTVTYGSQPVDVVADDWLGWGAEGYFVNLGTPTGVDGKDGSVWYEGTVNPDGAIGVDGDFYINTNSSDYFTKVSGTWGNAIGNLQGIQGIQGLQGDTGPDGLAATISVTPTAVTGAPGSDVSVANNGTVNAADYVFTIPRGDVGASGTDGGVGPTGPYAAISIGTVTGSPAGTPPTVVDGDPGDDVILNFTLEQGADGTPGTTGADGGVGPEGPEGPTAVSDDLGNKAITGTDSLLYVGADPEKVSSNTNADTGSDKISNMVSITQAEFDLLTPVATTMYVIVG